MGSIIAAVAIVALASTPAAGQPLPRAPDGTPDLSGIWQAVNSAAWNILPHAANPGVPAGLGVVEGNDIPYMPAAAARQRENYANRATLDPETKCWLPGVPRATYMGFPFQIVQTPNQLSILYEYAHAVRNIFMNSTHPEGPIEWWMGDSRGTWVRSGWACASQPSSSPQLRSSCGPPEPLGGQPFSASLQRAWSTPSISAC